jgi:predicted transcriptional regulator
VHEVFAAPGRIATQWLELPDGQRFFSIARTVGGWGRGRPRVLRAVALGCAAEHARASSMRKGLIRAGQRPRPSAFRAACAIAPPAPPALPPSGAR